ncbi:hypothetical protein Acsp04_28510 [Actinomadura sp. NBRC 104425]|uniref:AAA domain-containing protein n=1 Tax=Actinomadura sp. NBRC 104425 TaxID=3032204 RepID=UPI0024A5A4FA|nr:AAA domain-containing protein [Actinomadura sp. NBRC 104425]GLZ12616.1 hypothetical protein Acsp04_28510 [Actinomadura sp. NBRC 104425]
MGSVEDAKRLVRYLCCDTRTAKYGPFEEFDDESWHELLSGCLFSTQLLTPDEHDPKLVDLQIYLGLSELGGLLWSQEVRALSRVSGLGHPALPQLLSGGYEDAESIQATGINVDGVAFVATEGADDTLAESGRTEVYRNDRVEALRQFAHLADGLAVLHDLCLSHRNLSPWTIDVVHGGDNEPPTLRLARFELSSFVSSLLSGTSVDSALDRSQLARLVLNRGPEPLAYLAPERVRHLLATEEDVTQVESAKADVYSLAAIVWEWFVGPFPVELLPDAVPEDEPAMRAVRERLDELNRRLRRDLRATAVPEPLRALLHRMLDPVPAGRPTAAEVVNDLGAAHDAILSWYGDVDSERPYLVVHMPTHSQATFGNWGWLTYGTDTPEGLRELHDLIVTDLRRARIAHSPSGAEPFVEGGEIEPKRRATVMLVGERVVWFCEPYRMPDPASGQPSGTPLDEALVIKYVARRDLAAVRTKLDDLLPASRPRLMPEFKLIKHGLPRAVLRRELKDRPSWKPLLDSVRPAGRVSQAELDYQRAIDWLLEFQGVELQARCYPYRVDRAPGQGGEVFVYWDRERDRERIHRSALFTKYVRQPGLRPAFGDFFDNLENEDGSSAVELFTSETGRKHEGSRKSRATVVRREGPDRIVIRREPDAPPVPQQGWIRPADDIGAEAVQRRQANARWELFALRPLTSRLRNPEAIRMPDRWPTAGKDLIGSGPGAVQDMLRFDPFFALQGPPGTGKTTVTSRAIAAYLEQEPTHRVLVSAQSNFTLDNLAVRILRDIGAMDDDGPTDRGENVPIALRVKSQRATPDKDVQPWLRDNLVVRQARQIRAHVERQLARGVDDRLRPVLSDWLALLRDDGGESVKPELADRLQRGANIVFATCGTATPHDIGVTAGATAFDWVIVEEAAKAWPTELAIPLVRGTRWTLIGDQSQLPAHRRDEVVRFLDSCIGDPNPAVAVPADKRQAYIDAFDLFRHLFDAGERPTLGPRPVSQLTTQFRMAPPIAEVVSRVFYNDGRGPRKDGLPKGLLETGREPDPLPLQAPGRLRGRSLVWLDTADMPNCCERRHWSNDGEVEIVCSLFRELRPEPRPNRDGYSAEPVAVLTPYRQQLQKLKRHRDLEPYAYTVHAFQGREADIVIVSLVRDKMHGDGTAAAAGYGHLARPDLINVMFSRARKLLVIVGNFAHFQRYRDDDGDFWQLVCRGVQQYGTVMNAAEVFKPVEAR